jgi:thiol-disulfide isomerase/thioredoxin
MKKISILLLTLIITFSCTKEHSKEYLSLSGKIENNKDSIITISNRAGVLKTIKINENGSFADSLNVKKGDIHTFQTNTSNRAPIYLKNGYNLTVKANATATDFMADFTVSGEGADNSNFILAQLEKSKNIGNPKEILALEQDDFNKKIETLKKEYDSILTSYSDIDSTLATMAKQQTTQMVSYFENTYAANRTLGKGKTSPKFVDYINFKGGKKSLDSFKGKYTYIDVWATWCGPCIREIPSLQALEKEYHSKNIAFVSISTDGARRSGGSWEAAEKKWRDFVKEKQLTGVQLWAGEDSSFQSAYQITGIPRFILVDPQGNIVDANAPRPSDPRLKALFSSLGI